MVIGALVYFLYNFNRKEIPYSNKETGQTSKSNLIILDTAKHISEIKENNISGNQSSALPSVDSSSKVKSEAIAGQSVDAKYNEIIQDFFTADNMNDISKVQNFYSNTVNKFWEMNTPSLTKIMNSYKNRWNRQQAINNKIVDVKKISSRSFEVNIIYSFTRKSDNSVQEVKSKIEIIFDKNDKIISVIGKQIK